MSRPADSTRLASTRYARSSLNSTAGAKRFCSARTIWLRSRRSAIPWALHRGQLARSGAVAELLRLRDSVEITLAGDVSAAETVTRLGLGAQVSETDGARLHLAVADQPAVLSALLAAGVAIHALTPIGETLEDLYIRITSAPPASAATDEARVSSEAGTRGDAQ